MQKYEIQKLRELPIEKVAKEMGIKVEHHKGNAVGTIDLVMRYLGKDFLSACRWLAEEHQVYLEDDRKREGSASSPSSEASSANGSSSGKSSSFDASRYARFFEHPWLNEAARRFLFEERKIDWRVVNWCRLTSWTDRDGVNWLQIPYFSTEGKLIGIQNRNLDYRKTPTQAKGLAAEKTPTDFTDDTDSPSLRTEGSLRTEPMAPRFRFPYGARCSIYNLPVVKMLKPGEKLFITEGCSDCWAMLSAGHKAIAIPSATLLKPEDKIWLAEIGEKLHTEWHMFPDRDAPGESLFMQLKEFLPQLVHHQLPPECKDFSEYYLKEKK